MPQSKTSSTPLIAVNFVDFFHAKNPMKKLEFISTYSKSRRGYLSLGIG